MHLVKPYITGLQRIGLLCILANFAMFVNHTFAGNAQLPNKYKPGLFTSLKDTSDLRRVEAARALYRVNCRKMNEADAMKSLDDLKQLATELYDTKMQCAVYDMRADYYSVNRGYNIKSDAYFDKAINLAKEEELPLETGIYQHRKANYYFLYKKNTEACRYYLLSEENFREVGLSRIPDVANLFSETANFYYALGDFENAREKLKVALKFEPKVSRTRINIINTIGLSYRNNGQHSQSMNYFDDALKMARSTKDSVWIAIAAGNIGSVYFLQHKYDKALPLIEADYRLSVKFKQNINAAIAILRMIRIHIEEGRLKLAALELDTADAVMKICTEDVLALRVQYYNLKSIISERAGDDKNADAYQDLSEQLRDSVAKRDNIAAIERVRLQWVTDKSREEFNNLKKNAELTSFKQNTIIIVLALLTVITLLIFNRQRLKAKKDKEILASEKLRMDEELKNASLMLHGYTESLTQKNELIDEIRYELENIQLKYNDTDLAGNLEKMMNAHIMTDENWGEFKKLFSNVHGMFFYNLRHNYSNLSGTDERLLALIKLKLNNKEMAGMLGITVDGIKKAKQRLRKKMELAYTEELEDAVNKL